MSSRFCYFDDFFVREYLWVGKRLDTFAGVKGEDVQSGGHAEPMVDAEIENCGHVAELGITVVAEGHNIDFMGRYPVLGNEIQDFAAGLLLVRDKFEVIDPCGVGREVVPMSMDKFGAADNNGIIKRRQFDFAACLVLELVAVLQEPFMQVFQSF